MKKLLSIFLTLILCLTATIVLTSCGSNESSVMTVSLNPKVEFTLDGNDKVLSVNALNEEGNLIIQGSVFVGLNKDEALKLYIDIAKDTGYLVSGSINTKDNKIEVAFSGADADKKFKEIESTIKNYFSKENIQASITQAEDITKEYIDEQLKKAEPYLEEAKLNAMTEQEKIKELIASRKETAEYYSESLKELYYQAKADAYDLAKLDYVKGKVDALQQIAIEGVKIAYTTAVTTLENAYKTTLVNENSAYQQALIAFREKKVKYLNYRNYISDQNAQGKLDGQALVAANSVLDTYKSALDLAETALNQAYTTAEQGFESLMTTLKGAYTTVCNTITGFGAEAQGYLNEASDNITTQLTAFTTTFESDFTAVKTNAKNTWAQMKTQLETGYQAG